MSNSASCSELIMVNEYIFRVGNSSIFIFASFHSGRQLFKERICSNGSKFFPIIVDPIFEGIHLPEKLVGSQESCSLCENCRETNKYIIHLNLSYHF